MKITVRRKSSTTASTNPLKASRSVDDMLDAFEDRIAELSVQSSTDIEAGCHADEDIEAACEEKLEASEEVSISATDSEELYKDVSGALGDNDAVYSLADLKQLWNEGKDGDPVIAEYKSFQEWFNDTKRWLQGPRFVGDVSDDDEALFD